MSLHQFGRSHRRVKIPPSIEMRYYAGNRTVQLIVSHCGKQSDGGTLPLKDFLGNVGIGLYECLAAFGIEPEVPPPEVAREIEKLYPTPDEEGGA